MGGLGFLNHMVYAAEACKVVIRRFAGDVSEDDVFLLNDPYAAAAHTSDVYLIAPIHHRGQLVAWSACFVHITDVGALNPGGFSPDSRDIYTEGFSSPGFKLVAGRRTAPGCVRYAAEHGALAGNGGARYPLDDRVQQRGQGANARSDRKVWLRDGRPGRRPCSSPSPKRCCGRDIAELPRGSWQARQYMDVEGNDLQGLPDHAEQWQEAGLRLYRQQSTGRQSDQLHAGRRAWGQCWLRCFRWSVTMRSGMRASSEASRS